MTNEHNAEYQMLRALRALRLELPREIVDDIGDRYMAVVDEKNREIERLRSELGQLREAIGQTDHYIVYDEDGWSIEHLVECRPNMAACGVHRAVARGPLGQGPPEEGYGRYRLTTAGRSDRLTLERADEEIDNVEV